MIQSAYNFCDIDIRYFEDADAVREDLQRLADLGTGIIYAGSYFCSNYFLYWSRFAEKFIDLAKAAGLSTVIVVPVPSDRTLQPVKEFLKKMDGAADELVVNDYSMLSFCGTGMSVPLLLGRLFMRQSRDPRYPDLMNSSFRVPFPMDSLKKFQKDYRVRGIEMEGFGSEIRAEELPDGMILSLHRPWFMMSCDFICEDASASLPSENKFRPDIPCRLECCGTSHVYDLLNGRVVKVGRGLYTWQEQDPAYSLPKNGILRWIEYYPYMEGVQV